MVKWLPPVTHTASSQTSICQQLLKGPNSVLSVSPSRGYTSGPGTQQSNNVWEGIMKKPPGDVKMPELGWKSGESEIRDGGGGRKLERGNKTRQQGLTSSLQFSRSVVSNSLRPHESQHARPPCSSPTPGAHPNSCPLRSNHLILCRPLLLPPLIFPSIRVFRRK